MDILMIVLVIAILVAFVLLASRRQRGTVTEPGFPYTASRLFSKAERSFLGVLQQTLAGQYEVFAKVRLADLLEVQPGLGRSAAQSALNRISSKHADFVLCDPNDLRTVAVIELDDASHRAAGRKARDTFFDGAFAAARIPVLRFAARSSYSLHEIRHDLGSILPSPDPAHPQNDPNPNLPKPPTRAEPPAPPTHATPVAIEPESEDALASDEDFELAMEGLYDRVVAACPGYKPTAFVRALRAHGGLGTAKRFLATGPSVQSGLARLADAGVLHVSMECLVLRFPHLFTPAELSTATQRLRSAATARPHLYPDEGSACSQLR
jgi:hypothetical protein